MHTEKKGNWKSRMLFLIQICGQVIETEEEGYETTEVFPEIHSVVLKCMSLFIL